MSKKKSTVWLHFSEEKEKKVKCLFCGQVLSVSNGSTCGLIRHLNKRHPTQIITRQGLQECEISVSNVSDENNYSASQPGARESVHDARPSNTSSRAGTISQYFERPLPMTKQRNIDNQLVKMVVKEYQPLCIVEDPEFKRFINMLNPNYKLPTRKTLSTSLIPAAYKETLEAVKNRLSKAFAICLTVDGWTSRAHDSFFSVTAHYISESSERTFLASDLITCVSYADRHTGENIKNKLREICDECGIANKIAVIVTDNAANMKAAVRDGGWRHWGCFAHTLNLIAQAGLTEIQAVLDKVKSIVRFFKKSSYAYAKLKNTSESMQIPMLKLINDVVTRWNSTYEMLERFLKLKDAVIATLALVKSSMQVRDEFVKGIAPLNNEEWLIVAEVVKVMEIFKCITTLVSQEKHVSASSIMLYVKQLKKHLQSFAIKELACSVQKMVQKLVHELNDRFKDIETNELITQATILDPRLKKFGFINELSYKSAVDKLYSKVANITIANQEIEIVEANESQ
ncbi:zinc finger BED domain-containing protein 6-like [Rhagoletis pomonella]|uniref:zinc finger BED domain-containing protein 6-like n=1 Tax=Rhagoletis pomonella TaxID=28610 RepID=UPI00177D4E93|nr:zinc finger BED domain-containing protein 6-like [Rhagoletis pomonella]